MSHLRIVTFFLILGSAVAQDTWNDWLNEGVRAFKSGRYSEAAAAFQKSVDLIPSAIEPRLYLASAWMNQYIPGARSPENLQAANNAERGFLAVLDLDPRNVAALESLASLKYLESQATQVLEDKLKPLEEARGWYLKVVEVDPGKKEAHYSLGVIAWAIWYPDWNAARVKLGMRPETPGPFLDATVRATLRSRYEATVLDGIDHLNKALAIDPQYDDAMAYKNLLLREYADLCDSKPEYEKMKAEADALVQKALDTRREKAEQNAAPVAVETTDGGTVAPPRRINVGGKVQEALLISRTPPKYPPEAKKAGIQGTVRLRATIARDGSVKTLELESGHPLLVDAAFEAVQKWKYRPTLLNGEPVEVVTIVDVNFVLDAPPGAVASNAPGTPPEPPVQQKPHPPRITIACKVVQRKLIYQPRPTYPPDAKQAGIEGDVVLTAVIAADGSVQQLDLKSGHPLLAKAAIEAVRQWKYQPTLLNGQPVEVVTSIHINFVLDKSK